MKLNDFIDEIHANAVAHGWWEEERPYGEVLALVHSEWSEALEEYRAGRPMVWHLCCMDGETVCDTMGGESDGVMFGCTLDHKKCVHLNSKPEGIAVELADGVIRIFDYFGHAGTKYEEDVDIDEAINVLPDEVKANIPTMSFPDFINLLHIMTVFACTSNTTEDNIRHLDDAVAAVLLWIKTQGIDPLEIMQQKHEYNKTRPYKHGKVC